MVSAIAEGVICPYKAQRGQLRHSSVRKYHQIVAPFLTDLLRAAADDRWSKLATNTNALPDYPGGAEAFKAMRAAMGAAELIDELPGYTRSYQMFGETQTRTSRTSFRPTPKLLQLAESHGVHLRDLKAHFRASTGLRPRAVLEARAAKDSKKTAPKAAEIDPNDPVASFIREGVQALNGHLLEDGRIEGISFAGLRRVFCNADQPGFSWQWHGRYYSARGADAYEAMEGGQASRQRVIRIDGHPVAEVDISAAHLTILHGLLELPFDASTDPYALDSVDRVHVKKWLTIALGAADPTAGGATLSKARAAGLERYPFLKDLPALGISALDLQYHEAEIMRLAMDDLRTLHGIGFLPVHDALMVATGNEEKAAQAIRSGFQRHFEGRGLPPIIPRVR
ncbi:hypothetical protein [Sphingobium sp.]|uniref:hypothetical protein n=1 Tax=Sphingobium sp. TaxID=1912891 RepID=UPI002D01BA3C|nr:hypothetical protein [Sphingobium sp.]HUD91612.1 hypothetical protein [Sphingobium sp.]